MSGNGRTRRQMAPERICSKCGGWAKVYHSRKLQRKKGYYSLYLQCTNDECRHRWTHHWLPPVPEEPTELDILCSTPDSELDRLYGNPDAPRRSRPVIRRWCAEILAFGHIVVGW